MTHDAGPALQAAWLGADGAAVLFGASEFVGDTTVLQGVVGADPATVVSFGFLLAGGVGLAHKMGVVGA